MAEDNLILSESEYERLLEEIHKLQARITELTALRDDLVYHVCPALRAEYDEKIVSLERELMAANMYLRERQRIIEILQAQMNQQKKPSMEEAQAQAREENRQYEDDLNRKAEEAREFREEWEKSQWSKHDEEERKTREEKKDREEDRSGAKSDGGAGSSAGENGRDGKDRDDGKNPEDGKDPEDRKDPEDGKDPEDRQDGKDDKCGKDDQDNQENRDGQDRIGQEKNGSGGKGTEQDGQNAEDPAGEGGDGSGKEESISQKIKRLYRKIVKRLHPDVHPDPTEHEKDLLNEAMKAFQEGNLEKLERIWDELSGMDAPEDVFDDTPEGREKLREVLEKLKIRLRLLELEIDHIKTEFPYKLKTFLEDPVAVEEVRRGIMSKIENVREMNRQLEEFIKELEEKLRKGETL